MDRPSRAGARGAFQRRSQGSRAGTLAFLWAVLYVHSTTPFWSGFRRSFFDPIMAGAALMYLVACVTLRVLEEVSPWR